MNEPREDDDIAAQARHVEHRPVGDPPLLPPAWLPDPDRVWLVARILAVAVLVVWIVAWPIGSTWANYQTTGVLRIGFGYSGAVFILALTNAGLVLGGGYLLRAALRLEATADRLGHAMRLFEPSLRSETIRADVDMLGGEVDRALSKLASAEQQIRQQVGAINVATETLRQGSLSSSEQLAKERQSLIEATKSMNLEAERFAAAIASRSAALKQEGESATPALDEQIRRLEAISKESSDRLEALNTTMKESADNLAAAPRALARGVEDSTASLKSAQRELLEESERLRTLIDQQRERADLLGRSLAAQSERLTKRRDSVKQLGGSWRRILDKVEKQVRGEDQGSEEPAATDTLPQGTPEERARLARLQNFTVELKRQLFGDPTRDELEQFAGGRKLLFAHQILGHDQVELRARLRHAINDDAEFANEAAAYLGEFDQLLAPIMASDPDGAEALLQDMLRSPLGQLYVLIGTTLGHFV
jgi:hypothetical protein